MTRTVITVTVDLANDLTNDQEVDIQERLEWGIVDLCNSHPMIVGVRIEGKWEEVIG